MPEFPEVETVARGLRPDILGRRILSVTLRKTDFIDDPPLLERHIPGRRIEAWSVTENSCCCGFRLSKTGRKFLQR